jgi:Ser/Thr protein kinase RdoA (MazF antagonist)
VLTKNGPAFIDLETLRVDLRVYDLFRLIRLAFKKNRWNPGIARAILNGYHSEAPLKPYEYDLLGVWFEFPYKVCKLLGKYDKSSPSVKRSRERRLIKELKAEQSLPELLRLLQEEKARGERDEDSSPDK